MSKIMKALVIMGMTVLLAGCMYPDDLKVENQIPAQDQLDAVQRAVNDYKADTGVLPIKNSELDTDIFIKYIIDFEKLVPKYISSAPANAYEKGGIFQYVIWDAEENPTVKLIDLRIPDRIRDVNARLALHDYVQFGEQVSLSVYTLNHKNLGFAEPLTVQSPYTNNLLPLVVTTAGEVIVDYTLDLSKLIQEKDLKLTPGEDIRAYLAENYPILPAYSIAYTVNEKNEPVFMVDQPK